MSLEPAKHNFTIWQGATFRYRFTWLTGGVGSEPYDLTNYTGLLEIRSKPQGTVLLTLTTDDDSITMGADGTITLLISAIDTAAITWTGGVYDFTITAPANGDTSALLFGGFAVKGI